MLTLVKRIVHHHLDYTMRTAATTVYMNLVTSLLHRKTGLNLGIELALSIYIVEY